MKITPWNRRLLVTIPEDPQEEQTSILVPEGYNPKASDFVIAQVVKISEDSNSKLLGKKIALTPNGLEEVSIAGKTHYLVLENYVVCVVEE